MAESKLNQAWNTLYDKYDIGRHIQEEGIYEITANEIKTVYEPRLVTKFDHENQLPKIFRENHLSILPNTRGSYLIAPFLTHHSFEKENADLITLSWNKNLESLNIHDICSETCAINVAEIGGILAHFLQEEPLYATVAGRMKSGVFDFSIDLSNGQARTIQVQNSQIEIDAGYETPKSLVLIEAKNFLYEDFLVRQLYYPFRTWASRVKKPVRTLFFMYTNGTYHLYEYAFENPHSYSSIQLLRQANYTLDDTSIYFTDLQQVFQQTRVRPEPDGIPFPQADSIERIINLLEVLDEAPLSSLDISERYVFKTRQGDYYANAGRYLGLFDSVIETRRRLFQPSAEGEKALRLSYKQRQLFLAELIFRHLPFYRTFAYILQHAKDQREPRVPSRDEIVSIMKTCHLENIGSGGDPMYNRRAASVRHWFRWLLHLCKDLPADSDT